MTLDEIFTKTLKGLPFPITQISAFFSQKMELPFPDKGSVEGIMDYIALADKKDIMPFLLREYDYDPKLKRYQRRENKPTIPDVFPKDIHLEIKKRLSENRDPQFLFYWCSSPEDWKDSVDKLLPVAEERCDQGYSFESARFTIKGDSKACYHLQFNGKASNFQLVLPIPLRLRGAYSNEERNFLKGWFKELHGVEENAR